VLRDLAEEANPLADQVDVIEACTESIGIWSRAGCPLLDDGDLPVDVDPEPPPADPRLLAMANRALGEQLAQEQEVCRVLSATAADAIRERDEARAEVERLLRTGACECPAEDVCRLTRERDEARAEVIELRAQRPDQIEYRVHREAVRERDEARAEVERLRAEGLQFREFHRRKVEGLTSSHAYLAAAADGAAVERARIVAWLRTEADRVSTRNRPAGLLVGAADAIEAGEHETHQSDRSPP
jgi:hypothetical protein